MLPAWQFILVWDTATPLFVFEIHQKNPKMAPRRRLKYRHEDRFSQKTWFSIMFSIYVLKSLCFFFICFATPVLQNHMNDRGNGLKKSKILIFPISKIVAFKGTRKNDVNMFCESDAPRLAIHISLGHRDTVVCFWNSSKKSKNGPTSMIEISARSPIFPENVIFNYVLDICLKSLCFL